MVLFQNDVGQRVTVNGESYRDVITKFFIPQLDNMDVEEK